MVAWVVRYTRGAISGPELQDSINAAMEEILTDPAALDELARYGLGEQALRSASFSVTEETVGLEAATQILVTTAGYELTSNGLRALQDLVLRRVRQRMGGDAVGKAIRSLGPPPGPDFGDHDDE